MQLPKIGKIGRYAACILMVLVMFLIYVLRLVQWQLIDGEEYEQISLSNRTDAIELNAARGEILDREGNVLAGNRTSYNIVYNALYMDYSQRNATIVRVIDLLEEREEEWRDLLPIVLDEEGNYQFVEERETSIAGLKEMLRLAEYATAEECIAELARQYGFEGFSKVDTRNVASVRYSMVQDGYSRTNPYVIAQDVSAETVGVFSQMSDQWPGIETRVGVTRYYGEDGSIAPHILGTTGLVSQEEYQSAVENGTAYDSEDNISGYKWVDTIGKDGIEGAFEQQLRGQRGQETIFTDDTGSVKSTAVTTAPREGNTVRLTLDSELQRVANLSLAKNIEGNTEAKECNSGAAVVLDVKDFGVLVSASYPTYDLNRSTTDASYYNELENSENKPFFNKALQGVYVPGSVFKPMVALAALQEGIIGAGTTFYCNKLFKYHDLELACTGVHENANMYTALAGSCNVYFCNVGLQLTIDKMDAYAEYFGLGEKTGLELYEETGIMSNRQDYLINHGTAWTDGVSAQAAIGQADNMFTPMQLAAYCATIANGGVRMQTHFLDEIVDYTGEEVVEQYQPVELFDAGLSGDVLGVVREGMIQVATSGTASDVFSDYPVAIAAKTGTAETTGDHEANLSFICYAPAHDPEIAVAVMLEYGNKGEYAKNVAKDILDQYFGYYQWDEDGNRIETATGNMVDDNGEVIKTKEELDAQKQAENQNENSGREDTGSRREGDDSQIPSSDDPTQRGDIPDAPFTGNNSNSDGSSQGSEASGGENPGSSQMPEGEAKPETPYYRATYDPPDD